jgi:hypothetical protein
MPIILRIGPYRFEFYASDMDEPPHIHVRRGRLKAKFWLIPKVEIARNQRFAAHELNKIERLVVLNRQHFVEQWHEYFDTGR